MPRPGRPAARAVLTTRVAEVATQVSALLARPPGPDLGEPNVLAGALATLCDSIHVQLQETAPRAGAHVAEDCATLVELTALLEGVRAHVTAARFDALERIHLGLGRLRCLPDTARLLPEAARELARCCEFDRVVLARVRETAWRAEAVWVVPDKVPEARPAGFADRDTEWVPFDAGVLETHLLRRRLPVLVHPDEHRSRLTWCPANSYVAAPICADGRVIGFLQADCPDRELTDLDRDNIASFADGFALVFERAALLERIERQRLRVHEAFAATEGQLAGLTDAGTVLIRRDQESVAVVRTAAGLRRITISPVDALFTTRERQVLELMVQGSRNRRIAEQLVVAEETVKSHVRSISRKLRASGRADAVARYLRMCIQEDS